MQQVWITRTWVVCQACQITSLFKFHRTNQPNGPATDSYRSATQVGPERNDSGSALICLNYGELQFSTQKVTGTRQKQIPWHHWLLPPNKNGLELLKLMLNQALWIFIPSSCHLSIWINHRQFWAVQTCKSTSATCSSHTMSFFPSSASKSSKKFWKGHGKIGYILFSWVYICTSFWFVWFYIFLWLINTNYMI